MKIDVQIDAACREPRLVVVADRMTPELETLLERLSGEAPRMLAGCRDDRVEIIEPETLIRVYTSGGRVIAAAEQGEYTMRLRLYELEERLDRRQFLRISNAEIINIKRVKHFDLSFAGTICVTLSDGTVTYASRRYVARIKQILGL